MAACVHVYVLPAQVGGLAAFQYYGNHYFDFENICIFERVTECRPLQASLLLRTVAAAAAVASPLGPLCPFALTTSRPP